MTGRFPCSWRLLQAGDAALLVELQSLEHGLALLDSLRARRMPGVVDCIPAARTVLVCHDPRVVAQEQVADWIQSCMSEAMSRVVAGQAGVPEPPQIEIPVDYSGPDLDALAEWLGMGRAELIERHTGQDFVASFAGFAPGFVYLSGGDPCFRNIPRLTMPRARVPAGSVAAAGDFSAVYPADSPGGWRLLGTTHCRMWDLSRAQPALIQPGFRVRFVDQARSGRHGVRLARTGTRPPSPSTTDVERCSEDARARSVDDTRHARAGPVRFTVLSAGPQTLVQDAGRVALSRIGVSASGALDRGSMARANQWVGNPDATAVLENAWGGLALRAHAAAVVAVAGASAPIGLKSASGMRRPAGLDAPLWVEAGDVLQLGAVRAGMRCYVAVRGGWEFEPVLGSRSTDTLSGLGPKPLHAGATLHVGSVAPDALLLPQWPRLKDSRGAGWRRPAGQLPTPGHPICIPIMAGPRDDWFTPAALRRLVTQEWQVTAQSNRIALQLQGALPLSRHHAGELPSEGVVTGAIQVPASGQPVLFLADHPLTGGYPVVAVVRMADLDRLAQVPPGARLRFAWHHNHPRNSL